MPTRTAIIIATKGRPLEVSKLLDALAAQTVRPERIVVSACDPSDVSECSDVAENVQFIFSSPGSCAQRNRALAEVRGKCDIIVFFDDDFIPSRFWVERIQTLLTSLPDVGMVTGRVLADGAKTGGIDWSTGKSLVDSADQAADRENLDSREVVDTKSTYGCNMALRESSVGELEFDERLILYGWLEDWDFSVRASVGSRMVSTDWLWGVHLGSNRGRTSGGRFGYSQIVNPWYLMRKGTMPPLEAFGYIVRALSANAAGIVLRNQTVDRPGRLRGNLIGVKDIVFGTWAPEKSAGL